MFPRFTKKAKNLTHQTTGQSHYPESDPSNYRPISLSCVMCKILEHIVASSLVKHFTELDIILENAAWFLRKEILQDATCIAD